MHNGPVILTTKGAYVLNEKLVSMIKLPPKFATLNDGTYVTTGLTGPRNIENAHWQKVGPKTARA